MVLKAANRWQAFGIHLALSISLFILLAGVIYFWWYPGFLFRYDGGLEGMKLIAGVDLTIGPFLTLCVYKVGKKSLVFDLSCIAVLQFACLCYGMHAVGKTRPIAVVYAAGGYASTYELGYENAKHPVKQIKILQDKHWPVWLAVDLPEESAAGLAKVWAVMGDSLQYNVENYVPYESKIKTLKKAGQQATAIKDSTPAMKAYQVQHPDLRFFPITTRTYEGYVAVDVTSGKIIDFFKTE